MHLNEYYKLVRDRIPEIIRENGNECNISMLNGEEYLVKLDEKLGEELNEYLESKSLEELADMLEVIYAIAAARGSSAEELEALRIKKKQERGGFEKRIQLNVVRVDD